jgi:hypothetical protein
MFRVTGWLFLATALSAGGCVRAQPPTDTGDSVVASPTAPSSGPTDPSGAGGTGAGALAYNPDMKNLFASDCVVCHSTARADGNYRMATYQQVMAAVRPGNGSSLLIAVTQPNGRMYRYFSGSSATRQAKASQVRTWIVSYNAQENR